jgi:hypothetical protein
MSQHLFRRVAHDTPTKRNYDLFATELGQTPDLRILE